MNLTVELARRMLAALPGTHNPAVIPMLAAGITRGLAVIPDPTHGSRTLYVILDSPLGAMEPADKDFAPVFLVGQRSSHQRNYLRLTGAVAWWFRCAARGGRQLKPPGSRSLKWARASSQSLAWIAIDGDLPGDPPVTPDPDGYGNYEWFALKDMVAGGIVYRIDRAGRMTLFQRLSSDSKLWGRLVLPARSDAIDVRRIVKEMHDEFGPDMELPPVTVDIPVMVSIPPALSPYLGPPASRRKWRQTRRAEAGMEKP